MLEREEREVVQAAVRFQIVDEAAEPRNLSVGVGPDLDIAERSLERRAAELRLGHELVDRGGELEVQRAVIFGQHVLAVGLFAHLDPRDRIFALVEIGDFVGRIFRRGIEHRDRDHGREGRA